MPLCVQYAAYKKTLVSARISLDVISISETFIEVELAQNLVKHRDHASYSSSAVVFFFFTFAVNPQGGFQGFIINDDYSLTNISKLSVV